MKKLCLSIVASLIMLTATITPAHASYTWASSARCNAGWHFFIHAPYPQYGAYYAWGQCVPLNVNATWPDGNLGENIRLDSVYNYQCINSWDHNNCGLVGQNYESGRLIPNWGNSVIAAAGCYAGYYMTRVWGWVNSSTVFSQDTSIVYRNGVC